MSSLLKYQTCVDYLSAQIAATSGFSNVTVTQGHITTSNARPSMLITMDRIETERVVNQYKSRAYINLGLEVLYQAESTFLSNLDNFIDTVNSNGKTACGINSLMITGFETSYEDKELSRAIIKVEAEYHHT